MYIKVHKQNNLYNRIKVSGNGLSCIIREAREIQAKIEILTITKHENKKH